MASKIKFVGLLLLSLSFLPNSSLALTKTASCTITEHIIIRSIEGKAQRYGSFEGSFGIGDTVEISFIFVPSSETPDMTVDVEINFKSEVKNYSIPLTVPPKEKSQEDYLKSKELTVSLGDMRLRFDEESLYFKDLESALRLARYYKGDWHGTWVSGGSMLDFLSSSQKTGFLATLDCRNASDAIDSLYSSLFDYMVK